jgi:2-dehydropantoate 2-reductase
MKISVIGAGALGTLYAGMMASAGFDVTLVCRDKDIEALKKGISITGNISLNAFPDISSMAPVSDVVFITVKSYDVASAVGNLKLRPDTIVVVIHNGLGSDEVASSIVGKGHVAVGVSYSGVTFLDTGKVRLAGYTETVLGSIEESVSGRLDKVADILIKSGLKARVSRDIRAAQWEKMYANVGINAITAITGLNNGMLLEVPELKKLVENTVKEAYMVSKAAGIKTDTDPVEKTFTVIKDTYNNRSSMLQDVARGKKTEIDVLNGKVSELGKKYGINTPLNDAISALIKGIEKRDG